MQFLLNYLHYSDVDNWGSFCERSIILGHGNVLGLSVYQSQIIVTIKLQPNFCRIPSNSMLGANIWIATPRSVTLVFSQ